MQYTDNPVADFLAHDAEQAAALEELPKCDMCGEPCQGEGYFEPEQRVTICEDCWPQYVLDNFWRDYE